MDKTNLQSDAQFYDELSDPFWQTLGFWLILSFFVVSALGNFLIPHYCFSSSFSDRWNQFVACSAIGFLAVQACLVAIWLTLGSQHVLTRLCLSLGTLLALVCIYVLGLDSATSGSAPVELRLLVVGIAFTFVGLISIPLALIRWRGRRFISRKIASQSVASQFGIRHLFTATAITALLMPLAQATFSKGDFQGGGPPWMEIIFFPAIYMLLSCLACLLSLALVFDEERRVLTFPLLAGVILLGSPIVIWVLAVQITPLQRYWGEMTSNSIAYTASLSMGLVTALTIFYLFGYRLQKT